MLDPGVHTLLGLGPGPRWLRHPPTTIQPALGGLDLTDAVYGMLDP